MKDKFWYSYSYDATHGAASRDADSDTRALRWHKIGGFECARSDDKNERLPPLGADSAARALPDRSSIPAIVRTQCPGLTHMAWCPSWEWEPQPKGNAAHPVTEQAIEAKQVCSAVTHRDTMHQPRAA